MFSTAICQICQREFSSFCGLANHLKSHSIKSKEYYDKYGKEINEGICIVCGEKTSFINIKEGYLKHCSNRCVILDPEVQKKRYKSIDWDKMKQKQRLKLKETNEKRKLTTLKKYGVEHIFQSSEITTKRINSYIQKYGVDNPAKSDFIKKKIKDTCIERGLLVPDEKRGEFLLYARKVSFFTKKNKKLLFEKWDGFDYYDNEYIRDNLLLDYNDKNYPTIDHKISVLNGFFQNISPEKLSSIENLCITKKRINSSKYSRRTQNEV